MSKHSILDFTDSEDETTHVIPMKSLNPADFSPASELASDGNDSESEHPSFKKPARKSEPTEKRDRSPPQRTLQKKEPSTVTKSPIKQKATKSPVKAGKSEKISKSPVKAGKSEKISKSPVKAGKLENSEKAEKPEKPQKTSRSPARAKVEKTDKSEKPEKSPRSKSPVNGSTEEYPFLDMVHVIRSTRHYDELKVELRKTVKGVSLFAREPIRKGATIAYYKLKIIKERSKKPRVKGGIYTFSIYDKEGEKIKSLTGDLCEESLEQPRRGIPFFAYFAKEPRGKQTCNAHMDDSIKDNYRDRETVEEGDFYTYRLLAMRDIPVGEEICWYYGDHYERDYEVSDRSR